MMPVPALLPVTGSETQDCHSVQQMTDDSWGRSSVNMVYPRPYLWPRGMLYSMVLPWKRSVFISMAQVTSKSKVDAWHLSCHNLLTCWNMRVMLSLGWCQSEWSSVPTMDTMISGPGLLTSTISGSKILLQPEYVLMLLAHVDSKGHAYPRIDYLWPCWCQYQTDLSSMGFHNIIWALNYGCSCVSVWVSTTTSICVDIQGSYCHWRLYRWPGSELLQTGGYSMAMLLLYLW